MHNPVCAGPHGGDQPPILKRPPPGVGKRDKMTFGSVGLGCGSVVGSVEGFSFPRLTFIKAGCMLYSLRMRPLSLRPLSEGSPAALRTRLLVSLQFIKLCS